MPAAKKRQAKKKVTKKVTAKPDPTAGVKMTPLRKTIWDKRKQLEN